jgi:dTMP kinase
VLELNLTVTRGLLPDRTFLVLVDPEEARRRGGEYRDRIERETEEFMRRADEAFRLLATVFPQRIVTVDGSRSPEEIAEEVREHVRPLL